MTAEFWLGVFTIVVLPVLCWFFYSRGKVNLYALYKHDGSEFGGIHIEMMYRYGRTRYEIPYGCAVIHENGEPRLADIKRFNPSLILGPDDQSISPQTIFEKTDLAANYFDKDGELKSLPQRAEFTADRFLGLVFFSVNGRAFYSVDFPGWARRHLRYMRLVDRWEKLLKDTSSHKEGL